MVRSGVYSIKSTKVNGLQQRTASRRLGCCCGRHSVASFPHSFRNRFVARPPSFPSKISWPLTIPNERHLQCEGNVPVRRTPHANVIIIVVAFETGSPSRFSGNGRLLANFLVCFHFNREKSNREMEIIAAKMVMDCITVTKHRHSN